MTIEEKYNLAMDIIIRSGFEHDKDIAISIADCIKNNRFFIEYSEGRIFLFLTWEDNLIDGKRYIFINNCWIEPSYRKVNTLTRLRRVLRYLLGDVHRFYWHDRKKDKVITRR